MSNDIKCILSRIPIVKNFKWILLFLDSDPFYYFRIKVSITTKYTQEKFN